MDERIVQIIMEKVNECEKAGKYCLHDSDILDILEECKRKGLPITRRELDSLLIG